MQLPDFLSPLDADALLWFVVLVGGYRIIAERGPLSRAMTQHILGRTKSFVLGLRFA